MSTKTREMALKHKAAFRLRRKTGLVQADRPWAWLTQDQVKALAVRAYALASHGLVDEVLSDGFNSPELSRYLREAFVTNLADLMRDLVMSDAVMRGGCWPVDADTPRHQNYPQIAADLFADLPDTWRPQYPLYKLELVRVDLEVQP